MQEPPAQASESPDLVEGAALAHGSAPSAPPSATPSGSGPAGVDVPGYYAFVGKAGPIVRKGALQYNVLQLRPVAMQRAATKVSCNAMCCNQHNTLPYM